MSPNETLSPRRAPGLPLARESATPTSSTHDGPTAGARNRLWRKKSPTAARPAAGPRRSGPERASDTAKSTLSGAAVALSLSLTTLLTPTQASAQEFTLHLEPALALWVDTPQSDRFTPGMYLAIRPGVALNSILALQWSYAFLYVPAADGWTDSGSAHMLSTGVRVRPLGGTEERTDHLGGLFVDFNLSYVNTDGLDRFGFDVGLGYGFQVTPGMSVGVVARYNHIIQSDNSPGFNENDAQFASLGLDFGFGAAPDAEPNHGGDHPMECPAVPDAPACKEPATACSDYDRDGICDSVDRCPTQAGPAASMGCPTDPCNGPPIVVLVQFKQDSYELPVPRDDSPQTMDPILDSVARAMAKDSSCRVCIVGYASEEGAAEHNETLSRNRAGAVQGYMTARGLDKQRMPTTGFGARCQLNPTKNLELNRRVEFRRLQEGESCPTTCTE